jgi:hypothetical protein
MLSLQSIPVNFKSIVTELKKSINDDLKHAPSMDQKKHASLIKIIARKFENKKQLATLYRWCDSEKPYFIEENDGSSDFYYDLHNIYLLGHLFCDFYSTYYKQEIASGHIKNLNLDQGAIQAQKKQIDHLLTDVLFKHAKNPEELLTKFLSNYSQKLISAPLNTLEAYYASRHTKEQIIFSKKQHRINFYKGIKPGQVVFEAALSIQNKFNTTTSVLSNFNGAAKLSGLSSEEGSPFHIITILANQSYFSALFDHFDDAPTEALPIPLRKFAIPSYKGALLKAAAPPRLERKDADLNKKKSENSSLLSILWEKNSSPKKQEAYELDEFGKRQQ